MFQGIYIGGVPTRTQPKEGWTCLAVALRGSESVSQRFLSGVGVLIEAQEGLDSGPAFWHLVSVNYQKSENNSILHAIAV
jgi:hypothetical protein